MTGEKDFLALIGHRNVLFLGPTRSHTLRQRAHNERMAGGYQVQVNGGVGYCTMGFIDIKAIRLA